MTALQTQTLEGLVTHAENLGRWTPVMNVIQIRSDTRLLYSHKISNRDMSTLEKINYEH